MSSWVKDNDVNSFQTVKIYKKSRVSEIRNEGISINRPKSKDKVEEKSRVPMFIIIFITILLLYLAYKMRQ